MKLKWVVTSLAVVVLATMAYVSVFFKRPATTSSQVALPSATIVLGENGYEPDEVTIVQGGTVTFSTDLDRPFWPASNLHPTHSIYSEFDPKRPLEPQEEWSFTFNRMGTFNFHDHVRSYFVGTIYVVEQ